MKFVIVLAAVLACALAEPQVPYIWTHGAVPTTYKTVGYTGVVPSVGYTVPTTYTAGVSPIAYSAHPMAYPYVHTVGIKTHDDGKYRARRDVLYTHPMVYSGAGVAPYVTPYTYKAYAPVADVPKGYNYGYAGVVGY